MVQNEPKPLRVFALEQYFDKYEFKAPYLLCCSDCQPVGMPKMMSLLSKQPEETQNGYHNLDLGYGDYDGEVFLRQSILNHYMDAKYDNLDVNRRELKLADISVLVPAEGISLFMNSYLEAGDHVVCVAPAYQSLYEIARSKGCKITPWNYILDNEEPIFRVQDLRKIVSQETKLLVINFPHNPTGFIPTISEMMDIIKVCEEFDITLFSDEMYRTLVNESHVLQKSGKQFTYPSVCELYNKTVTLSGVSKTVGLAGVRIGWLVADYATHPELLAGVKALRDFSSICPSKPSQALAHIALIPECFQDLKGTNQKIVDVGRDALKVFCTKYADLIEYYEPRGGSTVFLRLKKSAEEVEAFCHKCAEEWGIVLLPGHLYVDVEEEARQRVRFGLGRLEFPDNLKALDKKLEEFGF